MQDGNKETAFLELIKSRKNRVTIDVGSTLCSMSPLVFLLPSLFPVLLVLYWPGNSHPGKGEAVLGLILEMSLGRKC